jgi:hypothetical protein
MATAVLLSATLVGFLPQGDLLVLETKSGGEAILRRMSHDGAKSSIVARERPASLSDWVERRRAALGVRSPTPIAKRGDRWQAHGLELALIEPAPLGDRRFVELEAKRGERAIRVWRMPALARVEVGPLYLVPGTGTLIVSYVQKDRRGLETIDLASVLATLLNLEALAVYRAGDRSRAVEILEEAAAASPKSADAVYNLACLHALMGQTVRAKGELSIALSIDRVRVRQLARNDADLESVREDPEVRRWLGLEEQD